MSGAAIATTGKRSLLSRAVIGIVFLVVALVSLRQNPRVQVIFNKNETLTGFQESPAMIPMPGGAVGPESFAFDAAGGGPYTGVSDGRIIRWLANESRWVDFAVTSPQRDGCQGPHDHSHLEHKCGRPLGLKFDENTGEMYITDAYIGLLSVGPNGGLAQKLAQTLDNVPFGLTNALDIDPKSGAVYFTDSSARFPRRNHVSIIISGDNTGRLMKFDPRTKNTTLLLDNLKFPNGVALSQNGDFLLFVETTTCRLYKLWLKMPRAGNVELMAQLDGFPDNIKRNKNGEFWVGINSRRSKMVKWLISNPWIGVALITASPVDVTKAHMYLARLVRSSGMGIRLDKNGNVVEVWDWRKGKEWKFVSEVEEMNGELWIGSVVSPYAVKEKIIDVFKYN